MTQLHDAENVAANIIELLQQYPRNLINKEKCYHSHVKDCLSLHENRIKKLITLKLPITFILPAFPAKSPNVEKTKTVFPDLGETLSLQLLNNICKQIKKIYSLGAYIIICSDGRVFNDLVLVSDDDVNTYAAGIKKIITSKKLNYLKTFSLDDCYNLSYKLMRERVVDEYGEELDIIKKRVKTNEESKLLFNGIHRFIFEDQVVHFPSRTKNQIRQQSKRIAYQVVQRSNAWSNLLRTKFLNAIRLSIHPQPCGSDKLGIMLLESSDIWATPWHRVVLKQNNNYRLIRKKEAELLKATPIFVNNEFSHYVI